MLKLKRDQGFERDQYPFYEKEQSEKRERPVNRTTPCIARKRQSDVRPFHRQSDLG